MKKQLFKLAFLTILIVGAASFSASAQVYVSVHPAWHPVTRPAAVKRGYVWIDEDWSYRGGRYVSNGGRWAKPPHPGWVWVPGRWAHDRRGDQWIAGRWRKG